MRWPPLKPHLMPHFNLFILWNLFIFLPGYNNRVIKTVEDGLTVYEIRHAAIDTTIITEEEFEGCKFKVKKIIIYFVYQNEL